MQNWLQNKNQIDMTDLLVILGFPVSPMSPMSLTFCPPRCPLILLESRSIICERRRLRQIIDLRDTDKSRYFAITVFNNCVIIRSPSLFFKEYLRETKRSAIFTQERSQEGENWSWFHLRMGRIVFAAKNS